MTDKLKVERVGERLHLRLARPDVHNALDEELIGALTAAMLVAAADTTVRAVILSGEGKSFCAGADIHYMRRLADFDTEANLEDAHALSDLFLAIARCDKPVIARVHGAVIGGAVGLVAASDVVVAEEGTKFGFSEVRLGILPAVISPFVVRRLGPAASRMLFLTGERFGARRAWELGLVDRVVAAEDLDCAVDEIFEAVRRGGPTAQAASKRLLDEIEGLSLDDATQRTPEYIAQQRATDEAKEGFAAFFEKRPPAWAKPAK
jgi:methylglutaconyl-CoA hydratase